MSRFTHSPHPEHFPICLQRQLDWSEMDVLGHANNARYFTWFEEARMAYFREVGILTQGDQGWGPILAHTECQFLKPVTWPANLLLCARTDQLGRTSLIMEYAVFEQEGSSQEATCVAVGRGVIVLVHYQSGEKVPISEELRARIEHHRERAQVESDE